MIESNQSKIVQGILVVGGIYITYRVGKNIIAGLNKSGAQSKVDDSPAVRQAIALRSAINPSGISWMKSFDFTSVDALYNTAKLITNLDTVAKEYSNLYQDNMLDDLQSELSGSEYQKFLNIIIANPKKENGGSGTSPSVVYAKPNNLVVIKKDVYLRSAPDATNHGKIYEQFSDKNIIRLAKAGEFIGYATGRQQFDEVNNVKFIEVAYVINGPKAPASLKAKDKQRVSYWVSSSVLYVDVFPFYKNMYDAYPSTPALTSWMKPQDFFSLKGISLPSLLTRSVTPILNEKLILINYAGPNTLLGQLIMSMDTGSGEFIQFRTIDNTLRWVDKKYIIQN